MTETEGAGLGGQTYLVGDTLYLRALELGDARRTTAWRRSAFPIPAEKAEELLKEEVPEADDEDRLTLLACRLTDNEPIGAVHLDFEEYLSVEGRLHADPALGPAGEEVKAELLRLIVPWLSTERQFPAVWIDLDTAETAAIVEAERLRMRPAVRFRDRFRRGGGRSDLVTYEMLHPAWLERLGDPGVGIEDEGEPPAAVAAPARIAPKRFQGPRPPNTIVAGERLALRPMEVDDAGEIARSTRRETEAGGFHRGRSPSSSLAWSKWIVERAEHDPPEEVEFAVVLRETGELIGENGLYEIDLVNGSAETGTWIFRPEFRGGGYGTEAKHLLLEYAFDVLGLHMVYAYVYSTNPRSAAALRKQGYRDAGRRHWTELAPGGFTDWLAFDLLAAEWRAARIDGP